MFKWIKKNLPPLQQKWAMVTKFSEDKQFRHQMITFSEEKKNSSPNIIDNFKIGDKINISSPKMYKLVMKYLFCHYRS